MTTLVTGATGNSGRHLVAETGVGREDADYVIGWYADPPLEARTVDDTVERILGRPALTFDAWVAEHVDRFREPRASVA